MDISAIPVPKYTVQLLHNLVFTCHDILPNPFSKGILPFSVLDPSQRQIFHLHILQKDVKIYS